MISLGKNKLHSALHPYSLRGPGTSLAVWLLLLGLAAPTFASDTPPAASKPDVTSSILSSLKSGQVADAQGAELDPDFILSLVFRPDHDLPYGVRLRRAHFNSRLDLSNAQVPASLWLVDCTFDDGVDFTGTRVSGDLSLEQSEFRYPASTKDTNNIFIGLKVLGDTTLTGTTFYGLVNPPDPGLFAQYSQFEAFLRAHNYADDADRVLVAGKRRERATSFKAFFSSNWWKSLFLDLPIGYGTEPLRPLVFCMAVVILGTIVLNRPEQMEFKDDKRAPQKYSAFWYSLDKFAPVIDLKVADAREPKTPGLQRFALALRILGFVLVPIALASISGMFK